MTMLNSGLKGLNVEVCKCLVSNGTNMSHFRRLEVVDRGSESQLQVGKKSAKRTKNIMK